MIRNKGSLSSVESDGICFFLLNNTSVSPQSPLKNLFNTCVQFLSLNLSSEKNGLRLRVEMENGLYIVIYTSIICKIRSQRS